MSNIKLYFVIFSGLYKSIFLSLKYFPFKEAIHLPILVSRKTKIKCAKGSIITNCKLSRGILKIGLSDVSISDIGERSLWNVKGTIYINGYISFGAGCKIAVGEKGELYLGNNVSVTAKSEIACFKRIRIGDNCLISWNVLIMDTDGHLIFSYSGTRLNKDKEIVLGNNVWIAARCLILKGSKIPDGCIIGANSLIHRAYKLPNSIISGSPAIEIMTEIKWKG